GTSFGNQSSGFDVRFCVRSSAFGSSVLGRSVLFEACYDDIDIKKAPRCSIENDCSLLSFAKNRSPNEPDSRPRAICYCEYRQGRGCPGQGRSHYLWRLSPKAGHSKSRAG